MPVDHKKLAALAPKAPEPPMKGNMPGAKPLDGDAEPGAEGEPDVKDIAEKVEAGEGDPELMKLIKGYDADSEEPPDFIVDEEIWDDALDLVEPLFDELHAPYAVVLHVYRELGGKLPDDPEEEEGDQTDPDVGVGTEDDDGGGAA